MKILIPTCRPADEVRPMCDEIARNTNTYQLVISGQKASASVNRNYCLSFVEVGETAIMLDDDIEGFYPGWMADLLVALDDPKVVMASARLLNPDCSFGPTCSRCYDPEPKEIEIQSNGECILPTAAIIFRHRGHKFDEHFIGSGFEDSDWCHLYLDADPSAKFIQSNRCHLIHRNEMKNQKGPYWKHNFMYYWNKRKDRVAIK